MSRKIKEFIQIEDYATLDQLIERLTVIRRDFPTDAEPELKLKGGDVFGRFLCISYFRAPTTEERECDARYADHCRSSVVRLLGSSVPDQCQLKSAA